MSYVIEIRRPAGRSPLTTADLERLLEMDRSLNLKGEGLIVWSHPDNIHPLNLNVESDYLWTDGVYGDTAEIYLERLGTMARFLGARIFGEEGEDITEESADRQAGVQ